ncbi:radical SAM protein [Candidatus Bathyarchaeota archaeon]|nr:radical SAM protein [Candidatus Bathyarchaeota archaeon]
MSKLIEALSAFTKIMAAYHRDKLFKLNFAVTYKCNSRCKMCNIWKYTIKNPQTMKEELETDEIGQIFKGLGKLVWISLTGGEPFLRNDLVEIVQSAKDYCKIKMLNITSNGFNSELVADKTQSIAEVHVPLTFINVSLDGVAIIHDQLRGVKGAYDNAIRTLESLHKISNKHSNLLVGFEYTITPFNVGYFKALIDKLKKDSLEWLAKNSTITIYHQGNLYKNLELNTNQQTVDDLFKSGAFSDIGNALKLTNSWSILAWIKKTYLKHARKYIINGYSSLKCTALHHSLFLDPYGNVYPCVILQNKLGNLRDHQYDLLKLLKSENAMKLKQTVEACRKCWTPCEAYPSILTNLVSIVTT